MSRLVHYSFMILPVLFLIACGPAKYVLKPGGESAKIKTMQGTELTGELLFVQDSSVYISTGQENRKIVRVFISNISSMEIIDYVNRSWVKSVILFQAIPTVLLSITALSVDSVNPFAALLIFGLPTLITYIAFEASTPEAPKAKQPKELIDLQHLQKYFRYPQGLTPDQFLLLLESYHQIDPEQI